MTDTKKATESKPEPKASEGQSKASDSKSGATKKSSEPKSEKAASGQRHVHVPGVSDALKGPTQDDLNPAYAPLTADEE